MTFPKHFFNDVAAPIILICRFCRAMLCISAAYVVMRCLSVRVSATFVDCVEMGNYIYRLFSPSGRSIILVFPQQTGWQYSDGDPHNGNVECNKGYENITIFDQYLALSLK